MAAPPSARRDRINPAFPKLVEMTNQYVYGDVWERQQLSKRDRSMVTIAALVALGWQDQLNSHIGRGLTGDRPSTPRAACGRSLCDRRSPARNPRFSNTGRGSGTSEQAGAGTR